MKKTTRVVVSTMALVWFGSAMADPQPAKVASQAMKLTSYNASNPCLARKYENTFKLEGKGTHTYKQIGYGVLYAGGEKQTGSITLNGSVEMSTYWTLEQGTKQGKPIYVDISFDNGPAQHLATKTDTCSTQMP
jgi:hypothetical protein